LLTEGEKESIKGKGGWSPLGIITSPFFLMCSAISGLFTLGCLWMFLAGEGIEYLIGSGIGFLATLLFLILYVLSLFSPV